MKELLEQALSRLPESIADSLTPIVLADDFDATISSLQFDTLLHRSGFTDADLRVALLPLAACYAHVPISQFFVGAIVRGLSGTLYFGANMEFSGVQLGQSIHAEQAGISHAWMKGETGIKDVTVNHTPCGHCRQFMNELTTAPSLNIQLPQREELSLQHYLPESFGPDDLGIKQRLMDPADRHFDYAFEEPLLQDALAALSISHAPYTKNFSGIALSAVNGEVFKGAYAENAAFNPSLPPLQVALVQMRMAGLEFSQVTHVALVEMANTPISHLDTTQATLDGLNPDIEFSYAEVPKE
ncbi:cytidine deaminase [Vibrio palustris]|uniref:Cytidine deaminase n=1 Tax=Vibrio palustris TaxID=1918946 RepID=A0A1R4B262_9VIBR|nr:cytidine deaminase [Vibrio palustris]SJL82993.1 Cytidine deaminase [Vibrio palustris]